MARIGQNTFIYKGTFVSNQSLIHWNIGKSEFNSLLYTFWIIYRLNSKFSYTCDWKAKQILTITHIKSTFSEIQFKSRPTASRKSEAIFRVHSSSLTEKSTLDIMHIIISKQKLEWITSCFLIEFSFQTLLAHLKRFFWTKMPNHQWKLFFQLSHWITSGCFHFHWTW